MNRLWMPSEWLFRRLLQKGCGEHENAGETGPTLARRLYGCSLTVHGSAEAMGNSVRSEAFEDGTVATVACLSCWPSSRVGLFRAVREPSVWGHKIEA